MTRCVQSTKLIARSEVNHLGERDRREKGERERGRVGGGGGREKGKEGEGGERKKRLEEDKQGSNNAGRNVTRITLTHSCTLPQKLINLVKICLDTLQ